MSDLTMQAVLVFLCGSGLSDEAYEKYDVATLEDQLMEVIEQERVGEFDGNDFGYDDVTLYVYGADAEVLFRTIEPVLRNYPLGSGARVFIRPGGPEVAGRMVQLPS